MATVKLVIWDMDDTFWDGNLAENTMSFNHQNIAIVKTLIDRGIMNSICSKNDFNAVKEKLDEIGIFDLFIFPAISYNGKGQQVKRIIENCKLRAENVLFIDDNEFNCHEVEYYCKNIQILSDVDDLLHLLGSEDFKGKNDIKHERLKQYKILEQKYHERKNYDSNIEFLYQSDIRVDIKHDCENHFDRIYEMIQRTNQLNYTKKRISENELADILNNPDYESGYVHVLDKYGDYGIVGFYCKSADNILEHFLFSCRILGIGVEQYVYSLLDYPPIDRVSNDVVTPLHFDNSPGGWINQIQPNSSIQSEEIFLCTTNIIVRSGCDVEQMRIYLDAKFPNIRYEFNWRTYHRDHSYILIGCDKYTTSEKQMLLNDCPFLSPKTFETEIFSGKYKIIVYSVLMDYSQAVYKRRGSDLYVAYGYYTCPDDFSPTEVAEKMPRDFFDKYEFIGGISAEQFYFNLQYIRNRIPSDTYLIFLNGCEVDKKHDIEIDLYLRHIEFNKVLERFCHDHKNTYILDVRKYVTSENDLKDNIRHYQRYVYFQLAKELSSIVMNICKKEKW